MEDRTAAGPFEAEDVADYSKVEYWDARYTQEPSYDWFRSVYGDCVAVCVAALRRQATARAPEDGPLRVLHLGCGNSRLCSDIAAAFSPGQLVQVALDYSAVVIERMSTDSEAGSAAAFAKNPVRWVVGDVRDLQAARVVEAATEMCGGNAKMAPFDVVIDKGTMDALQAQGKDDAVDEGIDAMLRQVSQVLRPQGGEFLQFTWETPYFRKHWTMRPEYAWTSVNHGPLGTSDVYYQLCYKA